MARLPNGEVLVGQAPQIIKAFDIKSWGDVLLPWRIIERGIRGVTLLVARDADGAGGAQQGPQPETTTGTANQGNRRSHRPDRDGTLMTPVVLAGH